MESKEKIRNQVEVFYDLQKLRIAVGNRVKNPKSWDPLLQEIHKDLETMEKTFGKQISETIENNPVWINFLSKVKGIGPIMAAGLLAWFDPYKAPHVSSYWRRAGLHVINGKAPKRVAGKKLDFNPKLRAFIIGRVGRQLMMAKGFYFKLYNQIKAEEERKHPELTKLHIHRRALRKTCKIFLQHLWVEMRKAEGLPITKPYAVEKLGHTYIPWQPEK